MRQRHYPWLDYDPGKFDIRKIVDGARTIDQLEDERDRRVEILAASDKPVHQRMAQVLDTSLPRQALRVGYDPTNAQQFQIYQTAKVLKVLNGFDDVRMLTVFDRDEELEPDQLVALDWRRLHARLRHPLKASFEEETVIFGAGEVDYDDRTGRFRPHHHVFVAGFDKHSLKRLQWRYPDEGTLEIDELPTLKERATAISYALKNIAYRHPFDQVGPNRTNVRLHPREFRIHMEYLGEHDFRDFIFWMNHRMRQ